MAMKLVRPAVSKVSGVTARWTRVHTGLCLALEGLLMPVCHDVVAYAGHWAEAM